MWKDNKQEVDFYKTLAAYCQEYDVVILEIPLPDIGIFNSLHDNLMVTYKPSLESPTAKILGRIFFEGSPLNCGNIEFPLHLSVFDYD